MLKLENIVAGYGHITALKDVSLEVPQGSVVSLIGANGAGKTTTMKTIMGLVKPTSGRVIFEGQDITGRQTHQIVHGGISLVPEGRQILQDMSRNQGATVIIVTHNSALAPIADRVIYMHDARVKKIECNPNPQDIQTLEY